MKRRAPNVSAVLSNQQFMNRVRAIYLEELMAVKQTTTSTAEVKATAQIRSEPVISSTINASSMIYIPQRFWDFTKQLIAQELELNVYNKDEKRLVDAIMSLIIAVYEKSDLRLILNMNIADQPIDIDNLEKVKGDSIKKLIKVEEKLKHVLANADLKTKFEQIKKPVLEVPTPKQNIIQAAQDRQEFRKLLISYYKKKPFQKKHYREAIEQSLSELNQGQSLKVCIATLLNDYCRTTKERIAADPEKRPDLTSRIYQKVLEPLCEKFPEVVKEVLRELNPDRSLFSGKLLEFANEANQPQQSSPRPSQED